MPRKTMGFVNTLVVISCLVFIPYCMVDAMTRGNDTCTMPAPYPNQQLGDDNLDSFEIINGSELALPVSNNSTVNLDSSTSTDVEPTLCSLVNDIESIIVDALELNTEHTEPGARSDNSASHQFINERDKLTPFNTVNTTLDDDWLHVSHHEVSQGRNIAPVTSAVDIENYVHDFVVIENNNNTEELCISELEANPISTCHVITGNTRHPEYIHANNEGDCDAANVDVGDLDLRDRSNMGTGDVVGIDLGNVGDTGTRDVGSIDPGNVGDTGTRDVVNIDPGNVANTGTRDVVNIDPGNVGDVGTRDVVNIDPGNVGDTGIRDVVNIDPGNVGNTGTRDVVNIDPGNVGDTGTRDVGNIDPGNVGDTGTRDVVNLDPGNVGDTCTRDVVNIDPGNVGDTGTRDVVNTDSGNVGNTGTRDVPAIDIDPGNVGDTGTRDVVGIDPGNVANTDTRDVDNMDSRDVDTPYLASMNPQEGDMNFANMGDRNTGESLGNPRNGIGIGPDNNSTHSNEISTLLDIALEFDDNLRPIQETCQYTCK